MYEAHFQLRQAPFSIAPDPEFLYLSDGHREALAHLTYGLNQGGFVLITGEVGTGKTTLLRNLLQQMPADLEVAFILNPRLTVRELLETLCDELGIDYSGSDRSSIKQLTDVLNRHLLATHASGRSTVLIIDEAQNLAPTVLEQIRLLTNLETDKRKLLRIILLGQPELLELLARRELRQLAQRITARYHLRGLDREDTLAYVAHRLQRAGGHGYIFTRPALRRLHRISGGIPRVINLVADRAMLGAYAEGRARVNWSMIGRAAGEVLGRTRRVRRWVGPGIVAAATAGIAAAWLLAPGMLQFGATDDATAPTESTVHDPSTPAAMTDPPPSARPSAPAPADAAEAPEGTAAAAADVTAAPAKDPDTALEPAGFDRADIAQPAAAAPLEQTPVAPSSEPVRADVALAPVDRPAPVSAEPAPEDPASTARAPVGTQLQAPAMGTYQTQRLAYQAAFEAWGADYGSAPAGQIPCDFAPSAGLQCLGGSGTWADLRRFNLPAVLELWDDASQFYAALTAMSAEEITLQVAGTEYRLAPRDLSRNWYGGYVLLWQMPPDYRGTLKQGDRHPSVAWLRRELASLGIATSPVGGADAFDAGLRDAVLRFQEDESMLADGIVGPHTWIRLGQRLRMPQPRLED